MMRKRKRTAGPAPSLLGIAAATFVGDAVGRGTVVRKILLFGVALVLAGCDGHVDSATVAEGQSGMRCSAKVLGVADTGETINEDPIARLTLFISPPRGAPPFRATIEATVSRFAMPRNGDLLPVACDPANPAGAELIEQ